MPLSTRILRPAALALRQRGVDLPELQAQIGLPLDLTAEGEVSRPQALQFFERFVEHFRDADVSASIAYREHLNLSVFGPVGFAMMTAPTLGQALTTLLRYKRCVATEVLADIAVELEPDRVVIRWILGDFPKPMQDFVMELSLCFLDLAREQVRSGDSVGLLRSMRLGHRPAPDFTERLTQQLPGVQLTYDQTCNELSCDPQLLAVNLIASNAETFDMLCEQLEQMNRLNLLQHGCIANKLAKLLRECALDGVFLNLQQAAERMYMSSRTLTRRLDKQASSFQMINDYVRAGLACKLLRAGDIPVKAVAQRSGFASEAGFSRAFRKWFQRSPLEFRRAPNLEMPRLPLTRSTSTGPAAPATAPRHGA